MENLRIDLFHHIELGAEVLARLGAIEAKQDLIIANQRTERAAMAQIDDELTQLASDVTAEQGAVDSAVTLINGISAKIDAAVAAATAAGATPVELKSLTDLSTAVKAQTASLGAAVAANP